MLWILLDLTIVYMNDDDAIVWITLYIGYGYFLKRLAFGQAISPYNQQPRSPISSPLLSNTTFFHNRQLNSQSLNAGVTKTPWPIFITFVCIEWGF